MSDVASGTIGFETQESVVLPVTLSNQGGTVVIPVEWRISNATGECGIYRVSDGKQLWGGRVVSDGRGLTVTNGLIDPDGVGDAYIDVTTDTGECESTTSLRFMGVSYEGATDENPSDPSMNPDQMGVVAGLLISLSNLVEWNGTTYEDGLRVLVDARRAEVTMYGDQIYISALDENDASKCGMSFDANRDNRIKIWGSGFIPDKNGGMSLGSPSLGYNYYYGVHTSIQSTSDERVKHDMRTIDPEQSKKFVMALNPMWFRLDDFPEDLMAGFGANQFRNAMREAEIPEEFAGFNGKDPDHLRLDYGQVIAPLVSVIQNQQRIMRKQEKQIKALMEFVGMPDLED